MSDESSIEYTGPSVLGRACNHLASLSWTDKEISEAFNIPVKTVTSEREKCCRPLTYDKKTWQKWNKEKAIQAVYNFVIREGRWPVAKDFKAKNDLPSMSTINWPLFPSDWQRREEPSGYAVIQSRIVKDGRKYKLTPQLIISIPNVTVRREAIQKFGFNRLVKTGAVEKMSEDEFGILWKIPTPAGEENMLIVEVINATKEPDGTYAHYFLRVPPEMTTPHQAVAWSFGVPTDGEWQNFKVEVAT